MKQLLYICMIAAFCSSCNKYLDIDEKGKVIPKSINDYYQLLSDYSAIIKSTNNVFYVNDEIKVYADEVNRIFYAPDKFTNGYQWKDYLYVNNDDNDNDWNNFYSQIYICNMVLSKIDEASGTDEVLRKQAKGEALAQRAYAYFMLVNIYAKHYDPATYATDPGVPLYTEPDISAAEARASVKEIYDMIEADLLKAADLVQIKPAFNYHPGKASVQGLLAKMYLYQGKWELARSYAEKALETNSFLYDYNDYDFMPGLPKFLGLPGYPNRAIDNKECVWHKQSDIPFIYMVGVYMSDEHAALYEDGDRRLYFTVIDAGPFGPNNHGYALYAKENFYKAGVYTPELYLIRAEANARLSHPADAIADLNTLRSKRITKNKYVPYETNKTDLEALQLVLKERRVEMFQESWRWFDLKRLNMDTRFKRTLTRTFGTETYSLAPDSKNYVIAIPKKVVILNPKVQQNPRDNR